MNERQKEFQKSGSGLSEDSDFGIFLSLLHLAYIQYGDERAVGMNRLSAFTMAGKGLYPLSYLTGPLLVLFIFSFLHACVPFEARKGSQIPWNYSYRWF